MEKVNFWQKDQPAQPEHLHRHLWIYEGSPWRIYADVKVPLRGVNLDENNPDTYKRFIFNPFTGDHKILSEAEIEAMRPIDKVEREV